MPQRPVLDLDDGVAGKGQEERSAGAVRVELGLAGGSIRTARPARVHARRLRVGVLAGERPLGAAAPEHLAPRLREALGPLLLGQRDRIGGAVGTGRGHVVAHASTVRQRGVRRGTRPRPGAHSPPPRPGAHSPPPPTPGAPLAAAPDPAPLAAAPDPAPTRRPAPPPPPPTRPATAPRPARRRPAPTRRRPRPAAAAPGLVAGRPASVPAWPGTSSGRRSCARWTATRIACNPGKPYFPSAAGGPIGKFEVIDYYAAVGEAMIRALRPTRR